LYILTSEPSAWIFENVVQFPVALLSFYLGHTYEIQHSTLCPSWSTTFPIHRRRLWCAGTHRGRTSVLTPLDTFCAAMEDSAAPFVASDLYIAKVTKQEQLSKSSQTFLDTYSQLFPSLDVYDLNNNPRRFCRKQVGSNMMVLTRGSTRIFSKQHGRCLTTCERLLAHGLPICSWAASRCGVKLRSHVLTLPATAQSAIAGNSQHAANTYHMVAYIFTCVEWV
jgi:hypothetical protein